MPVIGETKRDKDISGREGGDGHLFKWHACIDCGKERWVRVHENPSRCKACNDRRTAFMFSGEKSSHWRGGKQKAGDGYIRVRLYSDDFFYPMAQSDGYIFEHRLVMAKHLGRCLLPWELVHHKNGVARDDNRLEGLQLISDNKYHLIDTIVKRYIRRLEKRVRELEDELK